MLVHPEVIGQLVDTGGENGDLNLGGAGVALVGSVVQDDLGLLFLLNHDEIHLFLNYPAAK